MDIIHGNKLGGEGMTHLKIEGHGHLGDFNNEYLLEEGKEFDNLIKVFADLTRYVQKGKQKLVLQVFRELAQLEKEVRTKQTARR